MVFEESDLWFGLYLELFRFGEYLVFIYGWGTGIELVLVLI